MSQKSQRAGELNAERQRPTGGENTDQKCRGKKDGKLIKMQFYLRRCKKQFKDLKRNSWMISC